MTIAAGFLCQDGLVITADTLITGTDHKRHAAKLRHKKLGDNLLALAGAGTVVLIDRMWDDVLKQFNAQQTACDIVQMADEVIQRLFEKYIKADRELALDLVLGVRTPAKGLQLFRNDCGPLFATADDGQACCGIGKAVGNYFASWLFKPHMPMRYAATIGVHLVKQAKAYVPDCGGETHVLIVPPGSDDAYYMDPETVESLEGQLAQIETAMRKVLIFAPGIAGVDATIEAIQHRMDALAHVASSADQAIRWVNNALVVDGLAAATQSVFGTSD